MFPGVLKLHTHTYETVFLKLRSNQKRRRLSERASNRKPEEEKVLGVTYDNNDLRNRVTTEGEKGKDTSAIIGKFWGILK